MTFVAVLIDVDTRSSGEGFPLLVQRLRQGRTVDIYGTNGSFGMCCAIIDLPEDLALQYPGGQSRDANHNIQLDSNHALQGGVLPDVRVPLNWDTVYAMVVDGEDIVLLNKNGKDSPFSSESNQKTSARREIQSRGLCSFLFDKSRQTYTEGSPVSSPPTDGGSSSAISTCADAGMDSG